MIVFCDYRSVLISLFDSRPMQLFQRASFASPAVSLMAQIAPNVNGWRFMIDSRKVQQVLSIALENSMQVRYSHAVPVVSRVIMRLP